MKFEHRHQPLLSRRLFIQRVLKFTAVAMVGGSWAIGILGYHFLEDMSWIDATLNAAMILGGMGPMDSLHTNGGKLFASVYALFSGMVFLVSVGVMIAPFFHRIIHHFHLEVASHEDGASS